MKARPVPGARTRREGIVKGDPDFVGEGRFQPGAVQQQGLRFRLIIEKDRPDRSQHMRKSCRMLDSRRSISRKSLEMRMTLSSRE
jgi:hypothetical protein